MKTLKKYSILSILSLCICAACTEDIGMEQISQSKGLLKVFAYIGEASTAQTKAGGEGEETTPSTGNKDAYGVAMDEYYSYKATKNGGGFVEYCQIGMYSRKSTDGIDGNNRLVNEPLKFVKESTSGSYRIAGFQSENIEIESMTNLGETFVYYPYSGSNETENKSSISGELKYQIDLYVSGNNNPYNNPTDNNNQVIDLLTSTNSGSLNASYGVILYNFKHACSMLMIERGEGFYSSDNDDVIVKIKNKLQAYVYSKSGSFSLKLEPADESSSIPSEFPTNVYTTTEGKKIYSVILPPEAEVEYIKMEDNFRTMQYIRPENGMKLESGWKYPVTVKMNGFTPTIYPHEIVAWEDEVITIEKPKGIYDIAGFKEWITAYNGDDSNKDDILKEYGNKADDGSQWIFHLYADIDLKDYTGPFITTFKDKLEAHGHTISNIELQETTDDNNNVNVGLFGILNGGSINNLKIDGISFNGTEENINVGTIAGTVTSGSITNCKITGIDIESEYGYVGALAGSITAGTIETCLLDGELRLGINAKNDNKLFGVINGTYTPNQINTSGVFVFQSEVEPGAGDTDTGDEGSDAGDNTGNDTEGGN